MIDNFPQFPDSENDGGAPKATFEQVAAQDLANYQNFRQLLINEYVKDSQPVDFAKVWTVDDSPYDSEFMRFAVMKELGYEIVIHRPLGPIPIIETPSLEVSVSKADSDSLSMWNEQFLDAWWEDDGEPMAYAYWFIHFMKHDMDALLWSVEGKDPQREEKILPVDKDNQIVDQSYEERVEKRHMLLAKGYMTSVLINKIEDKDGIFESCKDDYEPKYVELYEQGHRPFDMEQLFGMVSGMVREEIELFDVAPPASTSAT